MSDDDKSRPLSPGSEGLPSKKPRGPDDEDSKSPPEAPHSPAAGEPMQEEPVASGSAATGAATGARPRTSTPKKKAPRSRSKSRSKSPLQRVVALFKKSPKPKPPKEGGTPKDVKETTAQWVRSKTMSPPPDPMDTEPAKRPSKKEKKKKPQGPPVVLFPLSVPSAPAVEVFERLPQDILDQEGIPKKPPIASVESMSTRSGSSQDSAKPSTSSGAVRPPPATATPRPSDWAGPVPGEEEPARPEERKLRPRQKEPPKK